MTSAGSASASTFAETAANAAAELEEAGEMPELFKESDDAE